MANTQQQAPSKNDLAAVFKRLRSIATNKICFDCSVKNPTWASVTYGVFICIDCSAVHRSLGVHLSFVRSTQLDTNWTWLQLRAMQIGGNANARSFFAQHNCTSTDAQQKYNSRAAALYKEKLHNLAVNAMRLHGTKLHVEVSHGEGGEQPVTTPDKKEVDFFEEHTDGVAVISSSSSAEEASSLRKTMVDDEGVIDGIGPNVDVALGTSPTDALKLMADNRKPTIGQRRAPPAKKGLGGKKGGLGAQKVSTNFSDLEKEAQLADERREKSQEGGEEGPVKRSPEEEAEQMASIRLAYQDLSLQKKKEEEKLRNLDPKKASQLERLGMGFSGAGGGGGRGGPVAHSAASEMKTIEQESPSTNPHRSSSSSSISAYSARKDKDFFDDEFELIGFTSGPPKYNDSPFSSSSSKNEDRFGGFSSSKSSSSWETEKKSSFLDDVLPVKEIDESHGRSRRSYSASTTPSSSTDEAVKKFGNAKSISSEQFFGNRFDSDFERKANLNRFEGSQSISSAEYFGDSSSRSRTSAASSSSYSGPDLEDIREGVRAGVTKVAGKLSNLANGVMSSLQERYGY